MKALLRCLLSLFLLASPAFAQERPEDVPLFSQAELDQILAPIALYPDQLLAQVLMAATYPLEVVQAARRSREHPGLQGQEAVRAVDDKAWDPSVKSLVAFPNLLAQMDADLDWTERLGDAFLAQQQQVMDTVQSLRQRAYDAGNLRSGEHVQVVREREVIYVRSAYPDVIYVPYYDPLTIYGSWWWPHYRPVYWAPWPTYGVMLGYGSGGGFFWGAGFNLGVGFFFSDWDWHHHHVRVVDYPPFYYRRPPYVQHIWVHDYHHRRGVPYRHHAVEERYVPVDGRPVRRHDYGDARDSDRDYRYRNGDGARRDDRDGDRGAYTQQERSREQVRDRDRNGSTAPAGGYRDRNATPYSGGPDRGGRPERDARSTPVNGAPARAARSREDLARPAPGATRQRSFSKDRETATERAPSGPATIERRTSGPRDSGNRSTTMPQQPTYRASSRPERIREPQGGTTSRPEQIREPRRSEPGMQQRTVAPRASEAPMQRQATPREVQRYPAPRNVQREMPQRSQPEAQPGVRSYPQAAPRHESRSGDASFVTPDRGNRDRAGGGAMERRDAGQQRQAEPRGQPFDGDSRHGGGDSGRGGADAGRGDRGNPRYQRP
jgi:hypothetical protein